MYRREFIKTMAAVVVAGRSMPVADHISLPAVDMACPSPILPPIESLMFHDEILMGSLLFQEMLIGNSTLPVYNGVSARTKALTHEAHNG